jgi:hypothetical protein
MTTREAEAAIDIALVAGNLLSEPAQIEVEDSRELVSFIQEAARRFEEQFKRDLACGNAGEYDYMTRIETFAIEELKQRYGKETHDGSTNSLRINR